MHSQWLGHLPSHRVWETPQSLAVVVGRSLQIASSTQSEVIFPSWKVVCEQYRNLALLSSLEIKTRLPWARREHQRSVTGTTMPWQPLAGSSSVSWSGGLCGTGEQRPGRWRVCAPFYCGKHPPQCPAMPHSPQSKTGSQSTWRQAGSLPAYFQSQKQAVGVSGIRHTWKQLGKTHEQEESTETSGKWWRYHQSVIWAKSAFIIYMWEMA